MKDIMNNYTIKVFDNIGANFIYENDLFVILGPLPGYKTLDESHVNYYIPYLVRSEKKESSQWELGIGYIYQENNRILVKRIEVTSSSNNNQPVVFTETNTFFVYLNANQFNTGLNNISIKNTDFIADTANSTYIIDASSGLVHAELPDAVSNKNLELKFRLLSNNDSGRVSVRYNKQELSGLSYSGNLYTSFISDGERWIELNNYQKPSSDPSIQSLNSSFSIQNTSNTIPYIDGDGNSQSTNLFWGANQKLLLGDSAESDAFGIFPTSGNYDTVINNVHNSSSFLVHGSGNGNLYFSYDGRLGLNMPLDINGDPKKPITLLHLVNTFCRDAIRIDNRSDCFPANINLYHRPETDGKLQNNDNIGNLIFSSITSDRVYSIYGNIGVNSKSISPGSSKGQVDISVNNGSPQNLTTTISTSPDNTLIGYDNSRLNITNDTIGVNATSLNIGANVNISGTLSATSSDISLNGTSLSADGRIVSNTLYLNDPSISPNQLLAVDNDRKLYAATGISFGLAANKVVTTDDTGTLIGVVDSNTYLSTGPDLTWNKFNPRSADVCLRQLSFTSDQPPIEEFSVGDQIAIIDTSGNYTYRYISSLTSSDNSISSAILDQDIGSSVSASVSVYSVTKGGYLSSQVMSINGPLSDATYIRLSTQPNVDTVFNGNRKNINFSVYSTENAPAFRILSNASTKLTLAGSYFQYATQIRLGDNTQLPPGSVAINSDLTTISSIDSNTVNYNSSSVASRLNGRPSYYGTFDQNGNAFEWIENPGAMNNNRVLSWALGTQSICGGSWKTDTQDKLRSIVQENFSTKKPDIGFRVCKRSNFNDSSTSAIYQSLNFVEVLDINNPPDSNPLYREGAEDRFDTAVAYSPNNQRTIPNLGRVNYGYQISKYEVTNAEYLQFLQSIDRNAQSADSYYVTTNIYNDDSKGITVVNNAYVLTDSKYANAPVTYITYDNAIRFINWLHNGALTREQMEAVAASESVTVDTIIDRDINFGAYTLNKDPLTSEVNVFKNNDQKYWLPSLNEWHKAAYYKPAAIETDEGDTAILVKSDLPKEISSGNVASVTVAGSVYSDDIAVGSFDDIYYVFKTEKDIANNYNITIGPDNVVSIPETEALAGSYGTYISNTGIVLATNGTIRIVCANDTDSNIFEVNPSGVFAPKLTIGTGDIKTVIDGGGITKIEEGDDPNSPTVVKQYDGPASGIIYKSETISDDQQPVVDAKSTDLLLIDVDNNAITLKSATLGQFVYANQDTGYLEGHPNITFTTAATEGLTSASGVMVLSSGNAIDTPIIRIGPPLETYKGRILTHNGTEAAEWSPADFLRADGMTYNRYVKRAVLFLLLQGNTPTLQKDQFTFTDLGTEAGGTGPVSKEDIEVEFGLTDTIAIYTPTGKVHYAKLSITLAQQSNIQDITNILAGASLFSDTDDLTVNFVPPIPDEWTLDDLEIVDLQGTKRYIAYVFSVQKGSFLDMDIEGSGYDPTYNGAGGINPRATSRFTSARIDPTGYLGFKPSTANTISIRPGIYTSFNKVAEDIDFAIYGYRRTLYNRYEEEWFGKDANGLPTGITPAFYVHSYIENSFEGSKNSGIYKAALRVPIAEDGVTLLPDQVYADSAIPDLNAKVCVNTKTPFSITSLNSVIINEVESAVYRAKLRGGELEEIQYGISFDPGPNQTKEVMVSGSNPLTKYADLTISGYTYSNNLIADSIYLNFDNSIARPRYLVNAPLTINRYGEIISLIPPAPSTPPGPPRFFSDSAFEGPDGITLYWQAPNDDGRSPIYTYTLQYSSGISVENENWITYQNPDTTANDLFVIIPEVDTIESSIGGSGLKDNVGYKFRLSAVNYEGSGVFSFISGISVGNDIIRPIEINTSGCEAPRDLSIDRKFVDVDEKSLIIESYAEDGYTVFRYTNPDIEFEAPINVGSNQVTHYVIDYAALYSYNDITETLVPLKLLQWSSANISYDGQNFINGEIPSSFTDGGTVKQTAGQVLTIDGISSDMTYYFRVRAKTSTGLFGSPIIIKSVGTILEPIITAPVIEDEDWDFGTITFTGGCE